MPMTGRAGPSWKPLRVVALLTAVASVAWEFAAGTPHGSSFREIVAARILCGLIATLLAFLSSSRRSMRALSCLALLLGLDLALTSCGVAIASPARAWETASILTAIILGAALFVPWPWRWQTSFAAIIVAAGTATFSIIPDSAFPISHFDETADIVLLTVAIASVLGARLGDQERQLVADSEARYRALFEESGDAIAVLDPTGVILDGNPRLATLLEQPADELLGRRLSDVLEPDRAGGFSGEIAVALAGDSLPRLERVRRHDGQELELELTFARASGPHGAVIQAILRDRTEHRALERRQVQTQRLDALARFAGGIAHQFNNLLGGILTHAGVLREDPAGATDAVEQILAAARRGRDLTKELIRFTNPAELKPQPIPITEVVDRVATLARAALPKTVRMEINVPANLPSVRADPDHLAHACHQLVLNARDAMQGRPRGTITISAATEEVASGGRTWPDATIGSYVRLSISDTGTGMDPTTLERVLEPFFTTKPMHQASGLGLAAVYGVVRDHGGSLRIESVPGQGTTVHLLIPQAGTAAAAAAPGRAPVPQTGSTILIVDDEAIVRSSVRRALTRFGHRVLEATDGPSALAAMQAAQPPVDLVILDLVLPGGGGAILELLKAVRPDVKVLVSSGYSPDHEVARGIGSRADGFLQKPFELDELRNSVARLLGG